MKLITILLASIVLASCSTKFNSKEEAWIAHNKYLKEGGEAVIVTTPIDEEVEREIKQATEIRKMTCWTAREHLRTGRKPDGDPIAVAYLQMKRDIAESECYEGAPIGVSKGTLTKRELKETRTCNLEEETSQFVCKEWRVKGQEISNEEWIDLEPIYTYFRF